MLNNATLTYTSGVINLNGYYLTIGSCLLDFGGASIQNLKVLTTGTTTSLKSDIKVTGDFLGTTPTLASPSIINSNLAGTQRKLTLDPAATQLSNFVTFTDIDASSGRKIWVWKPTLSNTNNIFSVSYTSFNTSRSIHSS